MSCFMYLSKAISKLQFHSFTNKLNTKQLTKRILTQEAAKKQMEVTPEHVLQKHERNPLHESAEKSSLEVKNTR